MIKFVGLDVFLPYSTSKLAEDSWLWRRTGDKLLRHKVPLHVKWDLEHEIKKKMEKLYDWELMDILINALIATISWEWVNQGFYKSHPQAEHAALHAKFPLKERRKDMMKARAELKRREEIQKAVDEEMREYEPEALKSPEQRRAELTHQILEMVNEVNEWYKGRPGGYVVNGKPITRELLDTLRVGTAEEYRTPYTSRNDTTLQDLYESILWSHTKLIQDAKSPELLALERNQQQVHWDQMLRDLDSLDNLGEHAKQADRVAIERQEAKLKVWEELYEYLWIIGIYDREADKLDYVALRRLELGGNPYAEQIEELITGYSKLQRMVRKHTRKGPLADHRRKIGRTCQTCRFSDGRLWKQTVKCQHRNKERVPARAHCARWRLTEDIARLKRLTKNTDDGKLWNKPDIMDYYYSYNYHTPANSVKEPIGLGRCCMNCQHKGKLNNNKVECTNVHALEGIKMDVTSACKRFKMITAKQAARVESVFNRCGLPTKGTLWMEPKAKSKPRKKYVTNRVAYKIFHKGRASKRMIEGWKKADNYDAKADGYKPRA